MGSVKFGNAKSCGCGQRKVNGKRCDDVRKGIDLAGKRFGKLVAIEPTDERRNGSVVWRCRCDCGKETFVLASNLVEGGTQSCGCGRISHIAGQRFGKLVAIEPTQERKETSIVWLCKCDCGNEVFIPVSRLNSGNTRSCGCSRRKKKE